MPQTVDSPTPIADAQRRLAPWLGIGAISLSVAVMAGAFAAHLLEGLVSAERLSTFETGVRYHVYASLGLMILGLAGGRQKERHQRWVGRLLLAGMVVFSGSLYVLVLTDQSWLGAVTPLGGVALIAGFVMWGVLELRESLRPRSR